jgi:hypothetical protein
VKGLERLTVVENENTEPAKTGKTEEIKTGLQAL